MSAGAPRIVNPAGTWLMTVLTKLDLLFDHDVSNLLTNVDFFDVLWFDLNLAQQWDSSGHHGSTIFFLSLEP